MKTEYPINLLEDAFDILKKYDDVASVSLMDRRIILTVNTTEEISQADIIVLQNIGFAAGGHFGAGGGYHSNMNIKNVEEIFIKELRRV